MEKVCGRVSCRVQCPAFAVGNTAHGQQGVLACLDIVCPRDVLCWDQFSSLEFMVTCGMHVC